MDRRPFVSTPFDSLVSEEDKADNGVDDISSPLPYSNFVHSKAACMSLTNA